ncbi:hypothetical protein Tco_1457913 [Tanacetum coccineum]
MYPVGGSFVGRYAVSGSSDMAYWEISWRSSEYGVLIFNLHGNLVKSRHGYTISFVLDMAYWLSGTTFFKFLRLSSKLRAFELNIHQVLLPSSFGQKDSVLVKSSTEDFTLPYHNTERTLPLESQMNTTKSLVAVSDSSTLVSNEHNESSVYSIPLPSLKKLRYAEPVSGPRTIKSILKSCSTFKPETLKGIINEPSSTHAKDKRISVSANADKLKNVKLENDFPLANAIKDLNDLKL